MQKNCCEGSSLVENIEKMFLDRYESYQSTPICLCHSCPVAEIKPSSSLSTLLSTCLVKIASNLYYGEGNPLFEKWYGRFHPSDQQVFTIQFDFKVKSTDAHSSNIEENQVNKKVVILAIAGCLCLVCLFLGAFLIFAIPATGKGVQNELSPLNVVPTKSYSEVSEISPQPSLDDSLLELSYIRAMAVSYTDDADPQYEGIAIDISFYDERSESINFSNIPISIQIELYGYHDILDTFEITKSEKVYQGSVNIDHSMRLGEMFGHYIRIPYEQINIDRSIFINFGTMVVTVETPSGIFSDTEDAVPLYPYEE